MSEDDKSNWIAKAKCICELRIRCILESQMSCKNMPAPSYDTSCFKYNMKSGDYHTFGYFPQKFNDFSKDDFKSVINDLKEVKLFNAREDLIKLRKALFRDIAILGFFMLACSIVQVFFRIDDWQSLVCFIVYIFICILMVLRCAWFLQVRVPDLFKRRRSIIWKKVVELNHAQLQKHNLYIQIGPNASYLLLKNKTPKLLLESQWIYESNLDEIMEPNAASQIDAALIINCSEVYDESQRKEANKAASKINSKQMSNFNESYNDNPQHNML